MLKKEAKVNLRLSNLNFYRNLKLDLFELLFPCVDKDRRRLEALIQLKLFSPLSFAVHLKQSIPGTYQY